MFLLYSFSNNVVAMKNSSISSAAPHSFARAKHLSICSCFSCFFFICLSTLLFLYWSNFSFESLLSWSNLSMIPLIMFNKGVLLFLGGLSPDLHFLDGLSAVVALLLALLRLELLTGLFPNTSASLPAGLQAAAPETSTVSSPTTSHACCPGMHEDDPSTVTPWNISIRRCK